MPKTKAPAANTVPVLAKAIQVFSAVAQSPGGVTPKSLAITLGIAPSTCYRILNTYLAAGWLRTRQGSLFELSFGLVPLLRPILRHEVLIETIREPLNKLANTTGLTAKLTVRQGDDCITIFSAQSPKPHAIASRVGSIISLAIGSSGAVHLSELPEAEISRILASAPSDAWQFQKREHVLRRIREARRLGYCSDSGSYANNIHTLSAPIYAAGHELVGAITLLGFPRDFFGSVKTALARELKLAAGDCNRLIQGAASTK